jgi:uncharacterized protein (TIGR03032 family)
MNEPESLSIEYGRELVPWILANRVSLVISCYKAHSLLSMGVNPKTSQIQFWITSMLRPMGLGCGSDGSLYVSSYNSLLKFKNVGLEEADPIPVEGGESLCHGWFDANYYPRLSWVTGDIGAHDVRVSPLDGKVYFCSVSMNAVLQPSSDNSFSVYWSPPWIAKKSDGTLPKEDHCHLNGLALRDGKPRYVTSACMEDR